jgi:hypothetical protein
MRQDPATPGNVTARTSLQTTFFFLICGVPDADTVTPADGNWSVVTGEKI